MSTPAHLTAINTSGAHHLRAVASTKHLHALRCEALSGDYIVTPAESYYSAYCYRCTETGTWYSDAPSIIANARSGIMSKSSSSWQTGHKACCTYYGRANAPSIDPDNRKSPTSSQRSEVASCVVAHRFDLLNLPSAYSITAAKISVYKPSFCFAHAPLIPMPTCYCPSASEVSSYENFHSLYMSLAASRGAPPDFFNLSNASADIIDLTTTVLSYGGDTHTSGGLHDGQIYNFWNFDSIDTADENGGGAYGLVPALKDSKFGTWVDVSLGAAPLALISSNRSSFWLRAGVYIRNAFSYGSSGAMYPGGLAACYAGGFAIKLTLSGGGS